MVAGGFGGLCENGHDVPAGAMYCPQCGSPAHPPAADATMAAPPPPPTYPGPQSPWTPPPAPYPPQGGYPYPPQNPYPPQPGYYPYYGAPAPGPGTNGLAIASMVLGIIWIYWIGSILAVIFGHVALSQIKRDGKNGRGMAIAGIALGWTGVGILLILLIAGAAVA